MWISVLDRLPNDHGDKILARALSTKHFEVLTGWYSFDDTKEFYHDTLDRRLEVNGVTHWMPLPDPPEIDDRAIAVIPIAPLNAEANARLIAAAPELLEALKAECAYWGSPPVDPHSYDSVREENWERSQAAIALATEVEDD